jgi:hypothetical protein
MIDVDVIDDGQTKDWWSSIHWPHVVSALLLLVGLALVVRSFFVDNVTGARPAWSEQQAGNYQEAAIKLHGLSHEAVHASGTANEPRIKAELENAQAEYDKLLDQLESARARPKRIAWLMRIGGALLLAAGCAVLFLPAGHTSAEA